MLANRSLWSENHMPVFVRMCAHVHAKYSHHIPYADSLNVIDGCLWEQDREIVLLKEN